MSVEDNSQMLLLHWRSHAMQDRKATYFSVSRELIMTKSSAGSGRDLKVRRNLQKASGPNLLDGNLDYRLRMQLNLVDPLLPTDESTKCMASVIAEMRAESYFANTTSVKVTSKGRPVGSNNKRMKKHPPYECSVVSAKKIRAAKYELAENVKSAVHDEQGDAAGKKKHAEILNMDSHTSTLPSVVLLTAAKNAATARAAFGG